MRADAEHKINAGEGSLVARGPSFCSAPMKSTKLTLGVR
jgi:hypothetical protein